MNFEYLKNYDEMSRRAADIVGGQLKAKPALVIGLPTGGTPIGMYSALTEKFRAAENDFSKVSAFNLDEYYPIEHGNANSYRAFMHRFFFSGINIEPENTHIPDGEADNPHAEVIAYDSKIESAGGLDIMILGLGSNGHVGFNEPGGFLRTESHIQALTHSTRQANKRFFDSLDQVPKAALTMGMGSIMKAKKILLLVTGAAKKDAFQTLLSGKITTECPVTLLNLHSDATVLVDSETMADSIDKN